MKWVVFLLGVIFCLIFNVSGRQGFGPGEQDWGHFKVREGAYTFWWLYYTSANVSSPEDRPLILWLQGGPSFASSAVGNFLILGPLDEDLNPRNYSWVEDYNVLFVDNPVGTGFSYVTNSSLFTTNNDEIAQDLLEFMKQFYQKFPQFESTELYVFGESYGGKMGVQFTKLLWDEVQAERIKCNITGVGMGNAWISPIDSILALPPLLHQLSLIEEKGMHRLDAHVAKIKEVYDKGLYSEMIELYQGLQFMIDEEANSFVSMYNFLSPYHDPPNLDTLMAGSETEMSVKKALNISEDIVFSTSNFDVYSALINDTLKPVTHVVESLLNDTSVKVLVYNGNLDILVATTGVISWVNKLKWPGADQFRAQRRYLFRAENVPCGFKKTYSNLALVTFKLAGHEAITYDPKAGKQMIDDLVNGEFHY